MVMETPGFQQLTNEFDVTMLGPKMSYSEDSVEDNSVNTEEVLETEGIKQTEVVLVRSFAPLVPAVRSNWVGEVQC